MSSVAEGLGTDLSVGLGSDDVTVWLERVGPNRLDAVEVVPAWRKFLAQFDDPLAHLLLGAVVVSLVAWVLEGRVGTPFEVIVITIIVVFNAVLGYVQEARAEQAVAALQRMTAATSTDGPFVAKQGPMNSGGLAEKGRFGSVRANIWE